MDRYEPESASFGLESPFAELPEGLATQSARPSADRYEIESALETTPSSFVTEGAAFAPDMAGLQNMLELEAGAGSDAAERAKGAAALVVGPALRRGSSGPAVEALQRALIRLGNRLAVDGRFGPGTELAIKTFQLSNDIVADGIAGPRTTAAIAAALTRSSPAPAPVRSPQPRPTAPSTARRLVIDHYPLLRSHRGTAPDLILRWNDLGSSTEVDVVVHFHGYSGHGVSMRIDRDKEPASGLDFADPTGAGSERCTEPTVGILPRGNFFGGKSGAGYDFPALTPQGALKTLVEDALQRVGSEVGRQLILRRLFLSGHSGGGAPISTILNHVTPTGVIIFDGTYGSGASIIRWAEKRISRAVADPSATKPVMRIIYRPGSQTAPQAEAIHRSVCKALVGPAAALQSNFRVDATTVAHNDIPGRFGWRLLADYTAGLPGVTQRICPAGSAGELPSNEMLEGLEPWPGAMTETGTTPEAEMAEGQDFGANYEPQVHQEDDEGESLQSLPGESLGWLDMEAEHEPGSFEAKEPEAEWLEAETCSPGFGEAEEFEPETLESPGGKTEWFGEENFGLGFPEAERLETDLLETSGPEHFEPAEAEETEGAFEAPYGYSGEGQSADITTLEALLETETGTGELTDRLKGVAAFVLGPTLQRGSSGPAVESLQRALAQLGHSGLSIDGKFGPATEHAVRQFQTASGLTSDGVVGPRAKAAIAAALGGSRISPAPAPPTPTPTPSGIGDTIARIAEREFQRWHSPAKLQETHSAAVPILQQYYRDGVKMTVSAAELQDKAWQYAHPWSAVFVSFVMRTAGLGSLFKCAAAHQVYVAAARRNRLNAVHENPFWAYRANEVAPEVGDLICAARNSSGATYDNIGDPGRTFATHCDIVTEVHPGWLRVIGGNVNQNVDTKNPPIKTLPNGKLDLSGSQSRFFAVVRCRGAAGGVAPTPQPPQPVPPPSPLPLPLPGPVPSRRSGKKLTPTQFVAAYRTFARASEAKHRVPALVTLGQAALESGWGERAPGYNFFGIKAKESDPPHTRQLFRTTEVYSTPDKKLPRLVEVKPRPDGKYTYVVDDWFRVYPDAAAAFDGHGEFLVRNKRYANAFTVASDPYAFATEVARAGYATAPNYAPVLHSVMRTIENASST